MNQTASHDRARAPSGYGRLDARLLPAEVAKFTAAVGLLAILADATVGHALAWENDPYWTYWVTKTFLIMTVFGLGTAWFGIGVSNGAALTAVHTVVLTVYYWSLAPVGLPSAPDWLDLEHTWVTGVPIHFAVIYLGYLGALWVWRRRLVLAAARDGTSTTRAWESLLVAVAAVVVMGAVEALAIGEFQGATWYVTRLLITVPVLLGWPALVGRDVRGAVSGAVVLTASLTAYGHFLGPVGLPDLPLRIFERDAPGATAHWLTYRQEALVALPLTFAVMLAAFFVLARADLPRLRRQPRGALGLAIGVVALVAVGAAVAPDVGPTADRGSITAGAGATGESGPYYRGPMTPISGTVSLMAVDRNPRVTPLPPHDSVRLAATFTYTDGQHYTVAADAPMVEDPLGRFTTWWGVGLDVWHHGRSGIGSNLLPAIESKVAVFAIGRVTKNGAVLANGVPVHMMSMPNRQAELDVGDPALPLPGLPNGHLRAQWNDAKVVEHDARIPRYLFGAALLAGLAALVAVGLGTEPQ